jgi:hypothetical protein
MLRCFGGRELLAQKRVAGFWAGGHSPISKTECNPSAGLPEKRYEAVGKGSDQWSCTKVAEAEGSDWERDVCGRVVSFATSAWACSSSLTVKM